MHLFAEHINVVILKLVLRSHSFVIALKLLTYLTTNHHDFFQLSSSVKKYSARVFIPFLIFKLIRFYVYI